MSRRKAREQTYGERLASLPFVVAAGVVYCDEPAALAICREADAERAQLIEANETLKGLLRKAIRALGEKQP